jgi:hypothetical protein
MSETLEITPQQHFEGNKNKNPDSSSSNRKEHIPLHDKLLQNPASPQSPSPQIKNYQG